MKGQAVNVDWSIALYLFIISFVASILAFTSSGVITGDDSLQIRTEAVANNLIELIDVDATVAPINVKAGEKISKPVKISTSKISSGTGIYRRKYFQSIDGEINAVIELKNQTIKPYFIKKDVDINTSNDINADTEITNTYLNIDISPNNIDGLEINNQETLSQSTNFGTGNTTLATYRVHGETFDGRLSIYNQSKELIVRNAEPAEWHLEDFNDLYWEADNSTSSTSSNGILKQGDTKGFSLASSYGITFVGDLSPTIERVDGSTIRANISAENYSIRLHDSGWETGYNRIKAEKESKLTIGAVKTESIPLISQAKAIQDFSDVRLQNLLGVQQFSYNMTISNSSTKIIERGESLRSEEIAVDNRKINILNLDGEINTYDFRVALWR